MIEVQNGIPSQYAGLFREYLQALRKKCSHIMWVVKERGSEVMMVSKIEHKEMVEKLLTSGIEQRERIAEEVMKRSIGSWRER